MTKNETVMRWIPVTERLPKEPHQDPEWFDQDELEECIVFIKGALIPTALYYAGDGVWYRDGNDYPVAAWMPLPDPYVGEE